MLSAATVFGSSVVPVGAVSRKTHGAAGAFDIALPLTGAAGVECRSGGSSGSHQIIISFANPVTFTSASITSGIGSVSNSSLNSSGNGTIVTVDLSAVANGQTIGVTLFSVNDGTAANDVVVPVTLLAGDVTGNGTISSTDVSQVKSQSGQPTAGSNFRTDVNVNGLINGSDVSFAKLRTGTGVNPAPGDPLDDPDGDSVPSIYEAAHGNSPFDASSTPAPDFIVDATIPVEMATMKKTIQAAIDAAPDLVTDPNRWTIIEVRPGDYPENVTIDNRRVLLISKVLAGQLPVLRGTLSLLEGDSAVDGLLIYGAGVQINTDADSDRAQLVNCVIRGASAAIPNGTAALLVNQGNVRVAHCAFTENVAINYPSIVKGIRVNAGALLLENSIVWDTQNFGTELSQFNITVHNSIVRGGYTGAFDVDPLFESRGYAWPDNGILLSAGSPAINAGAVLNVGRRDIHGGPRGSQPDIGADERNSGDSDSDGIVDEFEYRSFGNLNYGAGDDSDNDGLNFLGEFNAGTNPNDADTDHDSMSDGYEVANGLTPLDAGDALDDPDGDRAPNIYEAAHGSVANNASSTPAPDFMVDATAPVETATVKKTIQAAINAAPDLATDPNRWTIIFVRAGTYPENITISNRRILLLGDNTMPKVTSNSGSQAIAITQDGVAIDGLLFDGLGSNVPGALVTTSSPNDHVQFINCIFRGHGGVFNNGFMYSGLFVARGHVRIGQCAFTQNTLINPPSDVWGVILVGEGFLQLYNSILWNQGAQRQIANMAPSSIEVHNSIIKDGEYGGTHLDPRFESSTNALHHWLRLRMDSPAIDAGAIIQVGKRDSTGELRVGLPDLGPTETRSFDSDGDGLADDWEIWHFGDLSHSGTGDEEPPSGDGASNLQEFLNFTDPLNSDSDGDGIPDGYEIGNDLNAVDPTDYLADKDRDGVPNIYEYANHTAANDASAVPVPTANVSPGAGVLQAAINSLPTISENPLAWSIVKIGPGIYEEEIDLSDRRVLLLGPASSQSAILERPIDGRWNLLVGEAGCAINGVTIVGAARLAAPDGTSYVGQGGIFVVPNQANSDFRMENCIVRQHIGSALIVRNGRVLISHCAFLENYPAFGFFDTPPPLPSYSYYFYSGGAISAVDSALEIQDSILWDPTLGESPLTDSRANWLRSTVRAFSLSNSTINISSDSIVRFGEQGGADLDPGLTREGFIMPASSAINRGSPGRGSLLDIHGEARDAMPDSGADEFVDTDNDHLPDAWELRWFGDLSKTALQDSDGDGLSMYGEFLAGTNPNLADSDGNGLSDLVDASAAVNADPNGIGFRTDSDGDGLSDGFEIISGGDPFDPDTNHDGITDFNAWLAGWPVGDTDTDSDGLSFVQEQLLGTNPYLADTDGDGVNDALDFFPLDPTRSSAPITDPDDHTPPEIFLDVPENAIPTP